MIDKTRVAVYLNITFAFIVLKICISNGVKLNSNEMEAKQFAQQASDIIFKSIDQIQVEITKEDFDFHGFFEDLRNRSKAIFDESNKFDLDSFRDEELRYTLQSIRDYVVDMVISEDRFYEILYATIELEFLPTEKEIGKYGDRSVELRYEPDVINIIKSTRDLDELKYYWTEWRKVTGKWSKHLNEFLQGLREAAALTDMTPLQYFLQHYTVIEMDHLMTDISPFYKELHAFIRDRLQKKYGVSAFDSDGLIPIHLFEQVIEQAWTNQSIIEDIFPQNTLPPVEEVMKKRFMPINLYELGEGFYEKLGFEKYPYSIWNDSIKESEDFDKDDCKTDVFYSTPKVHLRYCKNMNFMDFLEAYAQMGNLYYAKEMKGLPAYFFEAYGLEEAVGKAVILSTSTHYNLKAIGMILDFNLTEKVEINRLFRKAIQKVLQLPLDYVNVKVMAGLLSEEFKLEELNDHYWKLLEKYAGVAPPKNHTSDTLDLPYNFFNQIEENGMSTKFNMEILSYTIYKKLCELSGKYSEGDLHLCDVHGSKKAGDALKKMMKLGKSKKFPEVLGSMFPESPNITADSLLEYYSPIQNFTAELNKEAGVKVGWTV